MEGLSQSLPNQVNDFNDNGGIEAEEIDACRNPFQTRSTTSIKVSDAGIFSDPMSQSLPNQVNDFNPHSTSPTGPAESCRNPFQTRSTTSIVYQYKKQLSV